MLKRYAYSQYKITDVLLETARKVDLDIEIKFSLGNEHFSIDVDKKQIDKLNDLYKALVYIFEVTHENSIMLDMAGQSLDKAASVLHHSRTNETQLSDQYKQLTEFGFNWLKQARDQYHEKDFGDVFEKYINN